MIIHAKDGIYKPKVFAIFVCEVIEPPNVQITLSDKTWKNAMQEECDALPHNNTWTLVPTPIDRKVVLCKWIFRIKRHVDGTIAKY